MGPEQFYVFVFSLQFLSHCPAPSLMGNGRSQQGAPLCCSDGRATSRPDQGLPEYEPGHDLEADDTDVGTLRVTALADAKNKLPPATDTIAIGPAEDSADRLQDSTENTPADDAPFDSDTHPAAETIIKAEPSYRRPKRANARSKDAPDPHDPRTVQHSPLLRFLRGDGPGPCGGLRLDGVLQFDFETFERKHDYIQWLFPTDETSKFLPNAPVLTPEMAEVARGDSQICGNMRRAFNVFLSFLGLEQKTPSSSSGSVANITRKTGKAFTERRAVCWVVNCGQGNHNWLRISRVLKSLRLLGLKADAEALYCCLEAMWCKGIIAENDFSLRAMENWRESAGITRVIPMRSSCGCL